VECSSLKAGSRVGDTLALHFGDHIVKLDVRFCSGTLGAIPTTTAPPPLAFFSSRPKDCALASGAFREVWFATRVRSGSSPVVTGTFRLVPFARL
jgi:hypothetical protein